MGEGASFRDSRPPITTRPGPKPRPIPLTAVELQIHMGPTPPWTLAPAGHPYAMCI